MPAINHIDCPAVPVEEDWTLTCLPDSTPDGKLIHFALHGSQTGPDGKGWSTAQFVSSSRRVLIKPEDWHVAWTLGYLKATLPKGFTVTWRSYPLFTPVYAPQSASRHIRLVQGCTNTAHTLTPQPRSAGGKLGIGAFIIHAPPR